MFINNKNKIVSSVNCVDYVKNSPGGSWNKLLTLSSGVVKKRDAITLYSPSPHMNYEENYIIL